jgi:iron uptake system component EfeO
MSRASTRALSAIFASAAFALFFSCGQQQATDVNPSPAAGKWAAQIDAYRNYTIEEIDLFVKETEAFVQAVLDGKIEEAKALYAPARMHYERIEPIAEALGDLDPNIDAREGDVPDADWRGYHRLEKALWQDKNLAGMDGFATTLRDDAALLRAKVETADVDISLLLTGAIELLNEVSASKVTGEEERYSHTDLYDFVANVQGAAKIFSILESAIRDSDTGLANELQTRFNDLMQALGAYQKDGVYVSYDTLTNAQTKALSQGVDALAEPLSRMAKILAD